MIGGNADRKGHAAIEGEYRETPIAGRARGERSRRSYVNPDRYVKEIRLWIQRERGREEGGGGGVWCVRHVGSIHRLRGEDGANRVVGMVI